jgi:processive 1,2-diacylglycerol beta-glucosyltransferase
MSPRILILTAGFGEGHNSAAKNLKLALTECGAEVRVEDPCMKGAPLSTKWVSLGYRAVTTYAPTVWKKIYRSTDEVDFSKRRSPIMRRMERCLSAMIEEFRPDVIVSTYPLYPYFLERIFEGRSQRPPNVTVVTDSIEINSAWMKAPTDFWLVTDPITREELRKAGLPEEKLIDTGFPVNPVFSELAHLPEEAPLFPFRVLFFATAKVTSVEEIPRAILNADPRTEVTVVMGRNLRRLYPYARVLSQAYPGRVTLKGWTRKVPQLLNSHHLVVGKAGGATVHEAIAAQCPMLVHHLVPGQEEGNLQLLDQLGAGQLADSAEEVSNAIQRMLAEDGLKWRNMKASLHQHDRKSGASCGAAFILRLCPRKTTS